MDRSKLLFIITTMVILSFVVAACGPSATPTPEIIEITKIVEGEPVIEVVTAMPEAKVSGVVRVGTWDSAEGLTAWDNAIAAFEAEYPAIEIQLESVPDSYGEKLLTQFAAGEAPDIFQVGDGDVARFVKQGAIENLDPFITGDSPLDLDSFFPGVLAIGQIEGSTYLLTKDYSPLVIYYNKDLFDANGVPYPEEGWTWDDFVSKAAALTKDLDGDGQTDQWGIQLPDHWGDPGWWRGVSPIVFSNGGDLLNQDGTTTDGYMNSAETVGAIEAYIDLFNTGIAPSKADTEALAGVDLFQGDYVAMLWTGRWPISDYIANPTLNFGTIGMPKLKEQANSICWAGFAMFSEGKNKEAAWEFMRFIGAGEGAQAFAKYALTPVQAIAELQGLDKDRFNAPIIADLEYIHPLPEFRSMYFSECVEKFFRESIDRLLLEGGEVQAVMDEAVTNADTCLAAQD